MTMPLSALYDDEAGPVWRYFDAICKIPRPSKHEERIRAWILEEGRLQGWETRVDAVGNVVLAIPGQGRLADAAPLVLQGHMDMVCEKNSDVTHDFMNDPIRPRIIDGWVHATGTTLGADNGIGVAMGMAVATEEMPDRLPLEVLITIDEETGLTGALELDAAIVKGRRLLNMDSEEDWQLIIGCAGGVDLTASFALEPLPEALPTLQVQIRGLKGGHSGVQIHEPRANALRAAGRLAEALRATSPGTRVCCLSGGNKKNAIPREADMDVTGVAEEQVRRQAAELQTFLAETDPEAQVTVIAGGEATHCLPTGAIDFLNRGAQGVLGMDEQFPDIVKTSNNMSVAETRGSSFTILMHGRSSSEADKTKLADGLAELAASLGGACTAGGNYPGWEPSSDSRLLRRGRALYEELFGKAPDVVCIHAGLEAGIIGAKLGTGELLSYGPTLLNPHSPDEKIEIESVDKVYRYLKEFVAKEP